jgi:hypothetical protein
MDHDSSDRIKLDMQDRTKVAQGAESGRKDTLMDELEAERVIRVSRDMFEIWEPRLEEVSLSSYEAGREGAKP